MPPNYRIWRPIRHHQKKCAQEPNPHLINKPEQTEPPLFKAHVPYMPATPNRQMKYGMRCLTKRKGYGETGINREGREGLWTRCSRRLNSPRKSGPSQLQTEKRKPGPNEADTRVGEFWLPFLFLVEGGQIREGDAA